MESQIDITEAELLNALQNARGEELAESGVTSREIQESTGWGAKKVRRVLETLIVAGAWEPVQVWRTSILTTISRPIAGYRPKASNPAD